MNSYNFRNIFILLLILLSGLTAFHFFKNITTPTDENVFDNVSNQFLTTQSITNYENNFDSIPSGVLLNSINNKKISSYNDLNGFISNDSLILSITYHNPVNSKLIKVNINSFDLKLDKLFLINSGAKIISVVKDGASDRAGLKVGDIILKVNGKSFKSYVEADYLMKKHSRNKYLVYTIIRESSILNISVKLANFGINFSNLILLFAGIIIYFLAGFIGISKPKLMAARMTSISLLLIGFNISNGLTFYYLYNSFWGYFQLIVASLVSIFEFPIYFHSLLYFPKEQTSLIKRNYLIKIPYLFASIMFSGFILWSFYNNDNFLVHQDFFWFNLFTPIYFAIYLIIYNIRNRKEQQKIGRTYKFIIFIIITTNFSTINLESYFSPSYFSIIIPLTYLLVPLIYIYTIKKYNLLEMNLKPSKSTFYFITQFSLDFLLTCIFLLGFYFLSKLEYFIPNIHFNYKYLEILDHPMSRELHKNYNNFILVIESLFFVIILYKFRNFLLKYIEKWFSRVRFDLVSTSSELSHIFKYDMTEADLCDNLSCKLGDKLKLKNLGIVIFKNPDHLWAQSYYQKPLDSLYDLHSNNLKSIFFTLNHYNYSINIEYLPELVKDEFTKNGFQLFVPIKTSENFLGYLLIGQKISETNFDDNESQVLFSIASHIGVALENVFLYEELSVRERMKHELDLARQIQLNTLPQYIPDINNLDITAVSLPAYEVGGDFYDYLSTSKENVTIIIGDVSGKGTSAALYMSQVQGIFRTLYNFQLSPKDLLIITNKNFQSNQNKSFFLTAISATFNTVSRSLLLARAGHLPVLHFIKKQNSINTILPKGMAIGMCGEDIFNKNIFEETISFSEDDIFVFYTDGLTEARNINGDEYGIERLKALIVQNCEFSAGELKNIIIKDVNSFAKGVEQFDDMTFVIVKIKN